MEPWFGGSRSANVQSGVDDPIWWIVINDSVLKVSKGSVLAMIAVNESISQLADQMCLLNFQGLCVGEHNETSKWPEK